jgi:hypothetical protein
MVVKKALQVLSVCFLTLIGSSLLGATWYVDGSVPKAGDGTSWEEALKKIQSGIDKAADGDTVIVAQGTYVENINFHGKNIVLTSTDPLNWSVVANTIIDGNKAGSVVLFERTENETCVLSGFTIRNGTGTYIADPENPGTYGGGTLDAGSNMGAARPTIEHNIITGNSSERGGGGVENCDGLVRNNIIIGNSCQWGGGIAFCDGTIENNLIVGNSATLGGAICASNAHFRNNMVVGNTASDSGGGLFQVGTWPEGPPGGSVTNCIVWENSSPVGPQLYASLRPTYCCIQNWTEGGEGNFSGAPRFLDPDGPDNDPNTFEDNDYRLLPNSPCIDAGTNEDWMNTATDLDGNPRILLGALSLTVDMGAYEYRFDLAIARNPESNVGLSWTMRPARSYTVLSSSDMMLLPWTEETTILGGKTGGPGLWLDPGASSALKFYKIAIE